MAKSGSLFAILVLAYAVYFFYGQGLLAQSATPAGGAKPTTQASASPAPCPPVATPPPLSDPCQTLMNAFNSAYSGCSAGDDIECKYAGYFSDTDPRGATLGGIVKANPDGYWARQAQCEACDAIGKSDDIGKCLNPPRAPYGNKPAWWQAIIDGGYKSPADPNDFGSKRNACRNMNKVLCDVLGVNCNF